MSATPTPTVEELLANDSLVNGDMGAAWDEIVARIKARLQPLIEAENSRKGWTGGLAMAAITDVIIAPTNITALHKNLALVAMEESTQPLGIGGGFISLWQVTVRVVGDLVQTPQQIRTMTRRGELVKTLLYPYLSGCRNADDVVVWRSCVPTGLTLTHELDKNISVAVVTFAMKQPPYQGG